MQVLESVISTLIQKLHGVYFRVKSNLSQDCLTFNTLKVRLLAVINYRILNGEFTERGLARILGISQPQIHNVLKGARKLTPELGDRLLVKFGMSLLDLLRVEESELLLGCRKRGWSEALDDAEERLEGSNSGILHFEEGLQVTRRPVGKQIAKRITTVRVQNNKAS